MANTQAIATSFKVDILNGLHAFGTSVVRGSTAADAFKAALYFATGALGAGSTVYTTTSEATGTNYVAGGVAVTFGTAPTSSGTTGYVTPSAAIVFTNVTVTAVDTIMVYNNTAASKNAVGVYKFSSQTIVNGSLTLSMPVNGAGTALINLA